MKAYLIIDLRSGLGDIYGGVYTMYVVQEQLKNLGYTVNVYVDFSLSIYKHYNDKDRSVFKTIYNFDLIENLKIYTNENISELLPEIVESNNLTKYKNKDILYSLYVDELIEGLDKLESFRCWQKRDNLPKINLLSEEVLAYCENKLKLYPKDFNCIHYRIPEQQLGTEKEEIFYNIHNEPIVNFLKENQDKPCFFIAPHESIKDRIKTLGYSNVLYNDYKLPYKWYPEASTMDNIKLKEYFFETIFDMYLISKATKIVRTGSWFSTFFFLGCTYNQTDLPNLKRFIPEFYR